MRATSFHKKHAPFAVLLVLSGVIAIGLQSWVGDRTIYSEGVEGLEARRVAMHQALLQNTPPNGGTWTEIGAGSHNIRIGTVYLADAISRSTGIPINRTYKLIDTVLLFGMLVGAFVYFRFWVPDTYALIGLLYLAAILPITYYQHFFQPWDRLQAFLWLILLFMIRDGRFWGVAFVLALSMFVKFDAILTPALYFLARFERRRFRRTVVETVLLLVIGFGIYAGLTVALPAPSEPPRFSWAWVSQQVPINVDDLWSLNLRHPILLGVGLPTLLALLWLPERDRFLVGSILLAVAMSIVWFLFTIYAELRAQISALLLIMPSALLSLQRVMEGRTMRHDLHEI